MTDNKLADALRKLLAAHEAEKVGELPALPKMLTEYNPQSEVDSVQLYTSDQMHAYARAAIAAQQESRND